MNRVLDEVLQTVLTTAQDHPSPGSQQVEMQEGDNEEEQQPVLAGGQVREVRGMVASEQVDLEPWLDPEVPAPMPSTPGTDGWDRILELGGWGCTLSPFLMMEEVPSAFREKWGKVVTLVLRKVREATTPLSLDKALLWFLVLPQATLRQDKRGGRRGQGAGALARRFDCILEEDWGGLLDMLVEDKGREVRRREVKRHQGGAAVGPTTQERQREVVLGMMAKGKVGRAARRISSNGVASLEDPDTMAALRSKYIARSRPLPATVTRGQCVDSLSWLKEAFLGLEPGTSPGTGGMRGEYLACLAEVWGDGEMGLMEEFAMDYLSAKLPPWFSRVWATVTTVPLYKSEARENSSLRPVGVKGSLVRVIHKMVAKENRAVLQAFLEPQQLCLTPGGAHKLVHGVRMLMERHKDWVCVKIDIKNAHNSVSRASVVEAMEEEPSLRHMAMHLATTLAPPSALESHGVVWGESGDGLCQGDGRASGSYATAWHKDVRKLDGELQQAGGCCKFGNDDGFLMGPGATVFPALNNFETRIWRRCGLRLQREKTEVFAWGELPPETPADLRRAGTIVEGQFAAGFDCYGVAVGEDRFVEDFLQKKVEEIARVARASCVLLEGDLQAKWTLLSSSVSKKFGYHLALQYPSHSRTAAARLDNVLWGMLEESTGLRIPRVEEGRGVECVLAPPVQGLDTASFQSLLVRLPVRFGGLGLESMVDASPAAFIGSVEMALPHFIGGSGLFPQLAEVLGELGQEEGEVATRWQGLLDSGEVTGVELAACWDSLQGEARDCCAFLEKELAAPLSSPLAGLGDGREDGSTRALVVKQRDELREAVVAEALKQYPDQEARPVWVFPQFDQLSQAWILATPNSQTFLPTPVFREAMAAHLCLPSPACQPHLGQPVGKEGARVDVWGDEVVCAKLPFDSWRHRHDDVQLALVEKADHARVPIDSEVFGLFRDLVPAAVLDQGGELEMVRKRQGKVPDLSYHLPRARGTPPPPPDGQRAAPRRGQPANGQGVATRQLAEIKVIGAGPSRYPRGSRDKAVDRRARLVPGEYRLALSKMDRKYHETVRGEQGPLEARLEQLCGDSGLQTLVVGRFGEASQHLHNLVKGLAQARAQHLSRTTGRPLSEAESGVILCNYRRVLSCKFVRGQEECLLARLGHMDEGARGAATRRRERVRVEEMARVEAAAFHTAHVRGRGSRRMGALH